MPEPAQPEGMIAGPLAWPKLSHLPGPFIAGRADADFADDEDAQWALNERTDGLDTDRRAW